MSAHATVGSRIGEDLRGAAGVLNRDGWSRGQLHDAATGAHDTTGAIYVATGYHQKNGKGQWRAHALKNSAGRRATDCIRWLVRSLPASAVWEFDEHHCLGKDAAIDALLRSAENAERLLRTPRDVEHMLPAERSS